MNNTVTIDLGDSLRLAAHAIASGRTAFSMSGDDPLGLHLPPVQSANGYTLAADTLRMMAALYLDAELEQAGVTPAAEILVSERAGLNIMSMQLAERLEQYAHRQQSWYDAAARGAFYARLFGVGAGATNAEGATINRDFEHRMAVLAFALVHSGDDNQYGAAAPSVSRGYQVQRAESDVIDSLSLRQFGNTLPAARQLHDQLEASIAILRDPAIGQMFGVQGMWTVMQRIMGDHTPDMARLVTRGQSGQQILLWLASVSPAIGDLSAAQPPSAAAVSFAQQWLVANGLDPSGASPVDGSQQGDSAQRQSAPQQPAYGR